MTAGAVISGAYFGDKMSPLVRNNQSGAPPWPALILYTHIRAMLYTAVPSILIALVMFGIIGLRTRPEAPLDLTEVLVIIEDSYYIALLTLIPLVVVSDHVLSQE